MRFTTTLAAAAILAVSGVTANAGGLGPVIPAAPLVIVEQEKNDSSNTMWILIGGVLTAVFLAPGTASSSM